VRAYAAAFRSDMTSVVTRASAISLSLDRTIETILRDSVNEARAVVAVSPSTSTAMPYQETFPPLLIVAVSIAARSVARPGSAVVSLTPICEIFGRLR
jgi:hypothetical protein